MFCLLDGNTKLIDAGKVCVQVQCVVHGQLTAFVGQLVVHFGGEDPQHHLAIVSGILAKVPFSLFQNQPGAFRTAAYQGDAAVTLNF